MVVNTTFNILQLYCGGQPNWWRKPEYPEKTTDLSQVTDPNLWDKGNILHRISPLPHRNTGMRGFPHDGHLRKILEKIDHWIEWIELHTIFCDKVCQWLATGQWFSPGTPVFSDLFSLKSYANVRHEGNLSFRCSDVAKVIFYEVYCLCLRDWE
jgi:hypothetical protein